MPSSLLRAGLNQKWATLFKFAFFFVTLHFWPCPRGEGEAKPSQAMTVDEAHLTTSTSPTSTPQSSHSPFDVDSPNTTMTANSPQQRRGTPQSSSRVRFRLSGVLSLALQVANLAACAVLLGWVSRYPVDCRGRTRLIFTSQIALSSLRLGLMGLSLGLTYGAGRAAVEEYLLARVRKSRSAYGRHDGAAADRDAKSLVDLRSQTQVRYDRLLVLEALVEPLFTLVQIGFTVVCAVLFSKRFEECARENEVKKAYIGLTVASLCIQGAYACLRLAYGSQVITWRGLFGYDPGPWEKHYQEKIEHFIRFVMCCSLGKARYLTVSSEGVWRPNHEQPVQYLPLSPLTISLCLSLSPNFASSSPKIKPWVGAPTPWPSA